MKNDLWCIYEAKFARAMREDSPEDHDLVGGSVERWIADGGNSMLYTKCSAKFQRISNGANLKIWTTRLTSCTSRLQ